MPTEDNITDRLNKMTMELFDSVNSWMSKLSPEDRANIVSAIHDPYNSIKKNKPVDEIKR